MHTHSLREKYGFPLAVYLKHSAASVASAFKVVNPGVTFPTTQTHPWQGQLSATPLTPWLRHGPRHSTGPPTANPWVSQEGCCRVDGSWLMSPRSGAETGLSILHCLGPSEEAVGHCSVLCAPGPSCAARQGQGSWQGALVLTPLACSRDPSGEGHWVVTCSFLLSLHSGRVILGY